MSNESYYYWMRNNPSEKVNAEYVVEIEKYKKNPGYACEKEKSLKLLKKFEKKDFQTFWQEPVCDYFPAITEGTMKIAEKVYTHDEAIEYAKNIINGLNPKELARAFLYGVSHNLPEYRTALACYYYVKNLPEHEFEKHYIGTSIDGDVYSDSICEVCRYDSELSDEPKMQFWHINGRMYNFYHTARVGFYFSLNTAIGFLEEYNKLPVPFSTSDDLLFFKQIISFIEALPEDTPPSKLRKALKQSGLLKMTYEQLDSFIDMLGYLNILHTDDSFGVICGHTKVSDMLDALSTRSYFAHPVNRWTRKCGIDYDMIDYLFGDLY